jgi:hypothetical protein
MGLICGFLFQDLHVVAYYIIFTKFGSTYEGIIIHLIVFLLNFVSPCLCQDFQCEDVWLVLHFQ